MMIVGVTTIVRVYITRDCVTESFDSLQYPLSRVLRALALNDEVSSSFGLSSSQESAIPKPSMALSG